MKTHSKHPPCVLLGSFCINSQRMFPNHSVQAKPYWHIQGLRGKEDWLLRRERWGPRGRRKKRESWISSSSSCKQRLIFSKLCPRPWLRTGRNTELEKGSIIKLPGNPNFKQNVSKTYDIVSITNVLCHLTAFTSGNPQVFKQVFSKFR